MSNASTETFLKGIESGLIDNQKTQIYGFIKRNPKCTIADIKFNSPGLSESSCTARISDLLDFGVIKIVGKFESTISTYSEFEVVLNSEEHQKLALERKNNKINKAAKKLMDLTGEEFLQAGDKCFYYKNGKLIGS